MKGLFRRVSICALVALCLVAVVALAGCTSSSQSSSASASSSSASSEPLPVSDVAQTVEPVSYDEPFWVMIVGNDTRIGTVEITRPEYENGNARSDTCMIMRVDPVNYKLAILTVPRDTAADVDGVWRKINDSYQLYGMAGILDQVKQLTGVECRYYFNMTFVQFENFVNELGGLTAYVPVDMSLQDIVGGDQIYLSAGEQKLNGAEALVLARMRKIYAANQDAVRQGNDRALVESGIRFVAANPSLAKLAADAITANSETNWDKDDLLVLINKFCEHANQLEIISGTGPYDGDVQGEFWLAWRDEDTWHRLVETAEQGGDLTAVVPLP